MSERLALKLERRESTDAGAGAHRRSPRKSKKESEKRGR